MSQQNIAEIFKNLSQESKDAVIKSMNNSKDFKQKSFKPTDDKSHFDRYTFNYGTKRVSVVYDTKAKLLTVTCEKEILEKIKTFIPQNGASNNPQSNILPAVYKRSSTDISTSAKKNKELKVVPTAVKDIKAVPSEKSKDIKPLAQKKILFMSSYSDPNPDKRFSSADENLLKTRADPFGLKQEKKQKSQAKQTEKKSTDAAKKISVETTQNDSSLEYKNGFSLKNYHLDAFNSALKQIKAQNGLTVDPPKTDRAGTKEEVQTYKILDSLHQKLYLRYMPQKKSVQLQGKQSQLFKDVQVVLYKFTDYKSAVNSYLTHSTQKESIKQDVAKVAATPQSASDNNITKKDIKKDTKKLSALASAKETGTVSAIEKKLKKLMPVGYGYLSDQSKKDITFALIDIYNDKNILSDYSALLLSPYRGLERLIYDLQTAENIEVKMIGQGFEKTSEGKYCLKSGYRKKINSVIYNEVLSDLYTEYFEKRNYYLHSDNTALAGEPRVISDKAEVKKIFENLLNIIDYNCTKLNEIGFAIDKNSKK